MILKTTVIDKDARVIHQRDFSINALRLTIAAESREELARSKGATFTAGAITFFGMQLVDALKACKSADELDHAAIDLAMAAWLYDSVFGGVTAEQFVSSDLSFSVGPEGAVIYQRLPLVR